MGEADGAVQTFPGGRPAAFGAEQGGLGGPVFRFCPSCALCLCRWGLRALTEPTVTWTHARLRASGSGLQGPLRLAPAGPLPGGWAFSPTHPGFWCGLSLHRQSCRRVCGFPAGPLGTWAPLYIQPKLVLVGWGVSCSSLCALGPRRSWCLGTKPEPSWPVPQLVHTSGTLGLGIRLLRWPLLASTVHRCWPPVGGVLSEV